MTQTNSVRMAPHDLEAEEAVLGSILIDPESLHRVYFLSPGDFFLVKHQWVWQAIIALNEQRAPIDHLTVCTELEHRSQLAEVGGQAYVSHLIGVVPTAIHAEGYGRLVEQASIRRKLLAAASDIAQLAYNEAEDIDTVMDRAEQAIYSTRAHRASDNVAELPALIAEYYAGLEWRYEHRGELLGLPTGFVDMDNLLGGLKKSDMIVLAGRTSTGKTSFLLNIALNTFKRFRRHVAIFSLEMSHDQVTERLLAQETGISSQNLQSGRLDDNEWPCFVEISGRLAGNGYGRIWIDDTPGQTPMQLRSKARRLHAQHGLDLVVVDYLQLMNSDGRRYENRNAEVTYQSKAIKNLARELNVPVVVSSQMSRAVEQRQDKRPQLSDLRDSGSIEQDADVVMFIHREDLVDPSSDRKNIAEIIVAKHRKGPTGSVDLYFRQHLTQFVNAARREVTL